MNVDWINGATQKELEQFKAVCNQLLSRTYVVRTLYKPEKGRVNNPDIPFCLSTMRRYRNTSPCWTGIYARTI
ncbi:MAG: hypothetical protein LIO78_06650 [Clostridiales bacterium]|nr:hypothetical protein [Clostridiales bacterium]